MMKISLFGATTVTDSARRWGPSDLGGAKPRQVLAMLAVDPGTAVAKDVIAERLWEGSPPASYLTTLEDYVCVLRRALGWSRGGDRPPLATVNRAYVLDDSEVEVDLVTARGLLRNGCPRAVQEGLDVAAAPLLAGEPPSAWVCEERDRFAQSVATACVAAAECAERAGDRSRAVRLARAAVEHSYHCDRATQVLMRALWRDGQRTGALRAYAELRAGLREDLGLEPDATSRQLYLDILREDAGRAATDHDEVEILLRLLAQAQASTTSRPARGASPVTPIGGESRRSRTTQPASLGLARDAG